MNTTSNSNSRTGDVIAVIGATCLLVGTATGNAIAMLVIAIIGLAAVSVISLISRNKIGRMPLIGTVIAASIGNVVAMAIAMAFANP